MPPTNSLRLSGASAAFTTPISTARLMISGITLSSRRRRWSSLMGDPSAQPIPWAAGSVNAGSGPAGAVSGGLLEDPGDPEGRALHGQRAQHAAPGADEDRLSVDVDGLDVDLAAQLRHPRLGPGARLLPHTLGEQRRVRSQLLAH